MNITALEELSMNAWPALQTLLHDGWVLRFADGYTRRANAVHPLYAGHRPLDERIRAAEAAYWARGQPTLFKMTTAAQPAGLDACLTQLGYRREAPTSVQTADLTGTFEVPATGAANVIETVTAEWLADFARLSRISGRHMQTARRILESLALGCGFASLKVDGETVACGLGVVAAGYLGLFDIVTGAAHRRRGLGRRLAGDILSWGRGHGAHTAYLQVMLDNAPALRLYNRLGFEEVYQYWYRVR